MPDLSRVFDQWKREHGIHVKERWLYPMEWACVIVGITCIIALVYKWI